MTFEKEILDTPERSTPKKSKFKSRRPSNLMIVLGIIHSLLGIYFLFNFFSALGYAYQEYPVVGYVFKYDLFLYALKYTHPSFLLGMVFLIGGTGLVRHKMRGWKYTLGISVFGIVFPALKLIQALSTPGTTIALSGGVAFAFLVLFIFSLILLISKSIRNFYEPRPMDYGIAGLIALILTLDFFIVPLIQ